MASALPVLVQNEDGRVPDTFLCPICYELPKKEVFQCRNGHLLCDSCHVKCETCPSCGTPFDKARPIRNLFFEGWLDKVIQVDCAYKLNGCDIQPTRNSVNAHQSKCYFNFEKFGKLMNLCEIIKYKDCPFRLNNGNCEDAVKHFMSVHGCPTSKAEHFQMELMSFQEATEDSSSDCFWTPVISDLNTYFLLTIAIFNGKLGSLTCISLIMPKLVEESSKALVMEYSFPVATESNESFQLGFLQSCIDLHKSKSLLPDNLPCFVLSRNIMFVFTKDGSLLVDCNLQRGEARNKPDGKEVERIVCFKRTASSNGILSGMEQKATVSKAKGRKHQNKEVEISGSSAGVAIAGEGVAAVSKAMPNTEILIRNLPPNTTLESITKLFAMFGAVVGGGMVNLLSTYLDPDRCKDTSESYILKFVHSSTVEKVMKCNKRRLFMKHNGKRHYLNVEPVEISSDSSPITTFTAATTFIDKAQAVCEINRDAFLVCVVEAFSKTGDLTVLNHLKKTMSIMAAKLGSLESMKYCIDKGIDLNLTQFEPEKNCFMSLLAYALYDHDKKIGFEKAKLLVESGADIHIEQGLKHSFLHLCVTWGSIEALKFFLDKGLEVNACNIEGWTPLHEALQLRHHVKFLAEKIKLLLDHGADVKIKDKHKRSAINYVKENLLSEEIHEMFRKYLEPVPNTESDATDEI